MLFQLDLMYPRAVLTDSFMVSPNYPVISILPLPTILAVSTNNTLPPAEVHANPLAIPGMVIVVVSILLLGPSISYIISWLIIIFYLCLTN